MTSLSGIVHGLFPGSFRCLWHNLGPRASVSTCYGDDSAPKTAISAYTSEIKIGAEKINIQLLFFWSGCAIPHPLSYPRMTVIVPVFT